MPSQYVSHGRQTGVCDHDIAINSELIIIRQAGRLNSSPMCPLIQFCPGENKTIEAVRPISG
jgi:hypothetical protein